MTQPLFSLSWVSIWARPWNGPALISTTEPLQILMQNLRTDTEHEGSWVPAWLRILKAVLIHQDCFHSFILCTHFTASDVFWLIWLDTKISCDKARWCSCVSLQLLYGICKQVRKHVARRSGGTVVPVRAVQNWKGRYKGKTYSEWLAYQYL